MPNCRDRALTRQVPGGLIVKKSSVGSQTATRKRTRRRTKADFMPEAFRSSLDRDASATLRPAHAKTRAHLFELLGTRFGNGRAERGSSTTRRGVNTEAARRGALDPPPAEGLCLVRALPHRNRARDGWPLVGRRGRLAWRHGLRRDAGRGACQVSGARLARAGRPHRARRSAAWRAFGVVHGRRVVRRAARFRRALPSRCEGEEAEHEQLAIGESLASAGRAVADRLASEKADRLSSHLGA